MQTEIQKDSFIDALVASNPALDLPPSHDIYGWLIGSWELEVVTYAGIPVTPGTRGEAHFRWVLDGKAIQDLWIMPKRGNRNAELGALSNMYGTTLRLWDPLIEAWRIIWINAATGTRDELIGRKEGKDLVQIGTHFKGTPIRWIFRHTTPDSFHWTGEALEHNGSSWKLEAEFHAKRIKI